VYQVAEVSFVTSRVRALTMALSAAALIFACGGDQPAATQSKPAALAPVSDSGYQLFLKTAYSSNTTVFDTQSQVMHHLPAGVMSEDGKRLLTIGSGEAGKKTLSAVDPATGTKLGEQTFEGAFQFPMVYSNGTVGGLSPKGRWLALYRGDANSSRRVVKSSYLVFDTTLKSAPKLIELNGDLRFDGIAESGRYLYVNDYYDNSNNYRVRGVDIPAGKLFNGTVVDKTNPKETSMAGTRVASVSSADGSWLYSLYSNAGGAPFVHALNLESVFAFCVDLERPLGADPNLFAIAMGPSGRLYAGTGEKGWLAEISTGNQPQIMRRTNFNPQQRANSFWFLTQAEAKELRTGAAAVSSDGKTVFVTSDSGVVALDTATLHVQGRYAHGEIFHSLAMSPDGNWLFGVSVGQYGGPGNILQLDAHTGAMRKLGETPDTFASLVRVEPKRAA
jgi:outer membrane protein assembly factor BamB